MNESFLQFIWKHQLLDASKLKTTDDQAISIINPGQQNTDAGPDFFNARIKIGITTWAGNVEIHQKASDWFKHKHQLNSAYDNVILHVVPDDDRPTKNSKGEPVPTSILMYPAYLENNYRELLKSKKWIACEGWFSQNDLIEMRLWSHALMIERLQQKTGEIKQKLQQNKNDWNETFYEYLAKNFGFKINALPFEMLARAVPLNILGKHKSDLFQLEALLFGSAGLLNEKQLGDNYFIALRKEYSFLRHKYKLKPIESHLWKFLRLRPVNFPNIRIAQFARLVYQSTALFSKLIEYEKLSDIEKLFSVSASSYWNKHYRFNKPSVNRKKQLGNSAIQNIVANTIVPFLFVYGEEHNQHHLKDRALDFLEGIKAENNSIISNWKKMGVAPRSAFESQALIQLKNAYCKPKKCLNCHLGTKFVKKLDIKC